LTTNFPHSRPEIMSPAVMLHSLSFERAAGMESEFVQCFWGFGHDLESHLNIGAVQPKIFRVSSAIASILGFCLNVDTSNCLWQIFGPNLNRSGPPTFSSHPEQKID